MRHETKDVPPTHVEEIYAQLATLCLWSKFITERDYDANHSKCTGEAYVRLNPEHWEQGVDPNDGRRVITAEATTETLVVEDLIRLAIEQQSIDANGVRDE